MQAALLLVFFLLMLIILLNYLYINNDGFTNPTREPQTSFVTDRLKQYNDIGISLITADKVGVLGNSANPYIASPPINSQNDTPLNTQDTGLFAITKKCESIQTMDCNAFNDPEFSLNCGICLDGLLAKNSKNQTHVGGLVLLAEDKKNAKDTQDEMNTDSLKFMPSYVATVGFCPAGKLVSTKEECIKLQRRLLCEKNQSFDLPGCSQCYSSGSYSIVDPVTSPGIISGRGTIAVVGSGILTIKEDGFDSSSPITLSNSPHKFEIRVNEAGRIRFTVTPSPNGGILFMAGCLYGTTFSGEFTTDLRQLILTDEISGRKPRSNGQITLRETPVTKMSPAFGQTTMTLSAIIPFTFVAIESEEASLCRDAPYITSSASSQLLQSDPCYVRGSGPGNYSLECLQNIWATNGCTTNGNAYPQNASSMSLLMSNLDGSFRKINDIANFIYNKALITSTGIDENGQKQSLSNWSAASMFCTGVPITSPCEGPTKNSGPLSADCIVYLWQNAGANNPLGPTYTDYGSSLYSSGTTPRYCQATGTLSPVDENGAIKLDIVEWWQGKGGVNQVKKIMSDTFAAANAQSSTDDTRLPYIVQCYGSLTLAERPVAPPPPPPPVYTCPPGSTAIINSPLTVKENNIIASNFAFTPDFVLTAYITPTAIVHSNWNSLIHFSTGNDQGPFGSRALGIWFYTGSITKMAIHIDHSTQPGWAARVNDNTALSVPFTIGKTSMFVIRCNGPQITIMVDGQTAGSFTHDGVRYSGNVTVYGSNPWYPAANCRIEKLCYEALQPYYPVCEVGSEQGMPACQPLSIRSGPFAPACGEMVSVFGKPNFNEFNFAIPVGQWNTLSEIRSMPGNNNYTIHGGDGNVSFAFPKNCSLKLTINNGENFSGPVTFVFTRTCPNSILSGACGQITFDRRWDYAKSIKCEKV